MYDGLCWAVKQTPQDVILTAGVGAELMYPQEKALFDTFNLFLKRGPITPST